MSNYYNNKSAEISDLVGKVCTRVNVDHDISITFFCSDGSKYSMYHEIDCCEDVRIEDICGDLMDLVGTPIVVAEESSNRDTSNADISCTWTFYKLATIKGNVTIRWYGTSNGYYSEKVSFLSH